MADIMAPGKSKKDDNKVDFEATMNRLETIVRTMEDTEVSLETSLEAFEQGIKLTREAQTALTQAEQKVQLLLSDKGEPSAQALPGVDEDNA